jgi:hypothetical protein
VRDSTFRDNTFASNVHDARVAHSPRHENCGNTFFRNNLVHKVNQAWDLGLGPDYWGNGPPDDGNYWSD